MVCKPIAIILLLLLFTPLVIENIALSQERNHSYYVALLHSKGSGKRNEENTVTDLVTEEEIISYAKYSLEKYLGSLYGLLSEYITDNMVEKGVDDGTYTRYVAEFILDKNTFKRGNTIHVVVYVHKQTGIVFTSMILVDIDLASLDNDSVSIVEQYVFNELDNIMDQVVLLLEDRGFTIEVNSGNEVVYEDNHLSYVDKSYIISYDGVELKQDLYHLGESLLWYSVEYDLNRVKSLSLTISPGYEIILYLLNKGYTFPGFTIGNDTLARIIDGYNINVTINDFKKAYIAYKDGIRPIYYVFYEAPIRNYWSRIFNQTYHVNKLLVVFGDNGEVLPPCDNLCDNNANQYLVTNSKLGKNR